MSENNKFNKIPGTYSPRDSFGGNDTNNGTLVGHITVDIDAVAETVTVTYHVDSKFALLDTHLWISETPLPLKKGEYTNSPGKFKFEPGKTYDIFEFSELYIAAHAVIRIYGRV